MSKQPVLRFPSMLDCDPLKPPGREDCRYKPSTPALNFENSPELAKLQAQRDEEAYQRHLAAHNRRTDQDVKLSTQALKAKGYSQAEIDRIDRGEAVPQRR